MNDHPLIGITSTSITNRAGSPVYQLGKAYTDAIEAAGGIPLILSNQGNPDGISTLIDRLDGVLLSGGGDVDPVHFGGVPHPKISQINPDRDQFELALLQHALDADRPLLAICRGLQVLNVAMGGALYTHIADQIEYPLKHDYFPDYPRNHLAHSVSLACGSGLDQIYGEDEIQVNSLHHQGISRVGAGLKATAFAADGLVEGVEVQDARFGIGVQWHPECLPDQPGTRNLFRAFVDAARLASR